MRLLIDINVVLDVTLQRPGAPASARLLALCGRQHEGWLAWHSVVTLAYLIERQQSALVARVHPRPAGLGAGGADRNSRCGGCTRLPDDGLRRRAPGRRCHGMRSASDRHPQRARLQRLAGASHEPGRVPAQVRPSGTATGILIPWPRSKRASSSSSRGAVWPSPAWCQRRRQQPCDHARTHSGSA